jgi:hypothetical protein
MSVEDQPMTADQFRLLLLRSIETLGVGAEVAPRRIESSPDSRWSADVEILARPGTLVAIAVADTGDEERLTRDVRGELRRALRMCPLCQRIGHVEKLRNAEGQQEACAVRCPACGEFEIDQALIRDFRSAWERGDRSVLDRLPAVSDRTREGTAGRLTSENWKSV